MRILFCLDSLDPRQVDPSYAAEAAAAEQVGITFSLVNYEALVHERNPERAVRKVKAPESRTEVGIFRGWMMTPAQYAALYAALEAKGIRLINTLEAYVHCHHLPESYPVTRSNSGSRGSSRRRPQVCKLCRGIIQGRKSRPR